MCLMNIHYVPDEYPLCVQAAGALKRTTGKTLDDEDTPRPPLRHQANFRLIIS